jgi:hypothetical protein
MTDDPTSDAEPAAWISAARGSSPPARARGRPDRGTVNPRVVLASESREVNLVGNRAHAMDRSHL